MDRLIQSAEYAGQLLEAGKPVAQINQPDRTGAFHPGVATGSRSGFGQRRDHGTQAMRPTTDLHQHRRSAQFKAGGVRRSPTHARRSRACRKRRTLKRASAGGSATSSTSPTSRLTRLGTPGAGYGGEQQAIIDAAYQGCRATGGERRPSGRRSANHGDSGSIRAKAWERPKAEQPLRGTEITCGRCRCSVSYNPPQRQAYGVEMIQADSLKIGIGSQDRRHEWGGGYRARLCRRAATPCCSLTGDNGDRINWLANLTVCVTRLTANNVSKVTPRSTTKAGQGSSGSPTRSQREPASSSPEYPSGEQVPIAPLTAPPPPCGQPMKRRCMTREDQPLLVECGVITSLSDRHPWS